jgi:Na+/H+-translocating membrane pyrophosphatase
MAYFMELIITICTLVGAVSALLFALFTARKVLKFDEGNDKMKQISSFI